jgi:Alginate export
MRCLHMASHPRLKRVVQRTTVDARPVQDLIHRVWRFVARRRTIAACILLLIGSAHASGQEAPGRRYLPDRSDENWSFLKEAPKTDLWDRLKFIPLGREDWFVTLSGEVRYRPEGFRIWSTSTRADAVDRYLLQRYLVGADVHVGTRARVFGEVQSGIINGQVRSPRPTDLNTVDVHQAFFEWRQPIASSRLTVKAGRQELSIGSARLISASPGLNVKRSFDGVTAAFRTPTWIVVGAAARLVGTRSGAFDDRADRGQLFWGAAAGRRSRLVEQGEIGAYYLGIDRRESLYAQGLGAERRHTIGAKWTRSGARFSINYDALFQAGEFRSDAIRAWAFATETTFRITTRGWRPRVNLRADIASGDRDAADPKLQSFNPLFPGNAYSGAVGLFGPTNLTDLTPALTVSPRPALTIGFEAPSYWRTSTGDGVYATDLRLLLRPDAGRGRYVGTNPGVLIVWQATPHFQLQGAITRFLPGAFLENTFVSSGFRFYSASAVYRF